jgi:hypothetical protein
MILGAEFDGFRFTTVWRHIPVPVGVSPTLFARLPKRRREMAQIASPGAKPFRKR